MISYDCRLDLCRYIYPSNKLSETVSYSKPDRRKKKFKRPPSEEQLPVLFSSNRATVRFSGHCDTQVTTTLHTIWHTHTNSDSPPISRGLFSVSFWGLLQTKYFFPFCTPWVLIPNSFARNVCSCVCSFVWIICTVIYFPFPTWLD